MNNITIVLFVSLILMWIANINQSYNIINFKNENLEHRTKIIELEKKLEILRRVVRYEQK